MHVVRIGLPADPAHAEWQGPRAVAPRTGNGLFHVPASVLLLISGNRSGMWRLPRRRCPARLMQTVLIVLGSGG
jgi:hypothetical protein